jgi:hypothetical protein
MTFRFRRTSSGTYALTGIVMCLKLVELLFWSILGARGVCLGL